MVPDEPVVEVHQQAEIPVEVAQAAATAAVAEAQAAVAIAEVQAEAAMAIAEVDASASVERAAVAAEETAAIMGAVTREEFEECRRNLETISQQQAATLSTLQVLEARLPPQSPVENPEGSRRTEPPGSPERVEQQAPEPPPKKKSVVRWT